MHSRIFLIGFMGSGKSTIGRKLANEVGYGFVDMDSLISQYSGMTIPGIFSEHGEALFRKWERDTLKEIIRQENIVVATGGGAPCHHKNMDVMNSSGLTIYLRLTPEAIRERLMRSKTERPLVKGKSDSELFDFIKELLGQREQYYLQSKIVTDGMNLKINELAEVIKTFRQQDPPSQHLK